MRLAGALRRRRPLTPRPVRFCLAVVCGAIALLDFATATQGAAGGTGGGDVRPGVPPDPGKVARGRSLFLSGCSSCHGVDAKGIPGRGPSLVDAGAAAADFYLRTGRMPLDDPTSEPTRRDPAYPPGQISALVNYVASLGHGPPIPDVNPGGGDLSYGQKLFTLNCAGCHQVMAHGGIATGAFIPDLLSATSQDVAEAVRVGPYVMPTFPQLRPHQIDSIARYVEYTHDPQDVGGWAIGHVGPIPEGMVAWLMAAFALVLVIRLIGERTTR